MPYTVTTEGGAVLMTHALALHATLPPAGSASGALAPATSRWLLLASVSAPPVAPAWSVTKLGAAPVSVSAATPSACEPER